MAFIIKRTSEDELYVSGYNKYIGSLSIGNSPKKFSNQLDAVNIAESLNKLALLEDDEHRFEVFEEVVTKVEKVTLHEGEPSSAYNLRTNKGVDHEVVVEIEE